MKSRKSAANDLRWERRFSELAAFRLARGHFRIPKANRVLAPWVRDQRSLARRGLLAKERRQRFNAIGFVWDPEKTRWEAMFTRLRAYRDKHGHCCVCKAKDRPLAHWASNQRCNARRGLLSKQRRDRLGALGFEWDSGGDYWQAMFERLKAYRQTHGHFRISKRQDRPLTKWAQYQRACAREGSLPEERRRQLDAIGFPWVAEQQGVLQTHWQAMFERLKAYRQTHGHFRISKRQDRPLAKWAHYQRAYAREGSLPEERRRQLDAIGFNFQASRSSVSPPSS